MTDITLYFKDKNGILLKKHTSICVSPYNRQSFPNGTKYIGMDIRVIKQWKEPNKYVEWFIRYCKRVPNWRKLFPKAAKEYAKARYVEWDLSKVTAFEVYVGINLVRLIHENHTVVELLYKHHKKTGFTPYQNIMWAFSLGLKNRHNYNNSHHFLGTVGAIMLEAMKQIVFPHVKYKAACVKKQNQFPNVLHNTFGSYGWTNFDYYTKQFPWLKEYKQNEYRW